MPGIEIVAGVAAVVSAFGTGYELFQKFKKRRGLKSGDGCKLRSICRSRAPANRFRANTAFVSPNCVQNLRLVMVSVFFFSFFFSFHIPC